MRLGVVCGRAATRQHRAFGCGKLDGKCFTETMLTATIFRAESAATAAGIAVEPFVSDCEVRKGFKRIL